MNYSAHTQTYGKNYVFYMQYFCDMKERKLTEQLLCRKFNFRINCIKLIIIIKIIYQDICFEFSTSIQFFISMLIHSSMSQFTFEKHFKNCNI